MRYFVNIDGNGDRSSPEREGAYAREIEFVEKAEGLAVQIYKNGEEGEAAVLEHEYPIDVAALEQGRVLNLLIDGRSYDVALSPKKGGFDVIYDGEQVSVEVVDERERLAQAIAGSKGTGPKELRASMPGIVVSLECEVDQEIAAGDTLLILEAMKMQNPMAAEQDGCVKEIHVEAGQAVNAGDLLITLG